MTQNIAQSKDDLPGKTALQSRSGLEFMHDVCDGRVSTAPICTTLNFDVAHVEDGCVHVEGEPEFNSANIMGAVHGGWYGAIMDHCLGCAVMTKIPRGSFYTTLEYKVNITRAIPPGTRVRAVGKISHAGRTTAVATGEIRGIDDDRLYATGSTTCLIMKISG